MSSLIVILDHALYRQAKGRPAWLREKHAFVSCTVHDQTKNEKFGKITFHP